MSEFTIIKRETGEVLRTGSCPEHALSLQAHEGEELVEGSYMPGEWVKKEGKLVPQKPKPMPHIPQEVRRRPSAEKLIELEKRVAQLEAIVARLEES